MVRQYFRKNMQDANQQEHKLYVGRLWFDKHGDILLQNYKIEEKCVSFIVYFSFRLNTFNLFCVIYRNPTYCKKKYGILSYVILI